MSPAAALQRIPTGIQGDARHVPVQGHIDGITDPIFRKPVHMPGVTQPLHNGFFGDCLAVTHAHQLTAGAFSGDGNAGVSGQKLLPWDGFHQLKQLLKGTGLRLCQHKQYPVRAAQPQTGPEGIAGRAHKGSATILRQHIAHAQSLQFCGYNAFQPKGGSGKPV